MIQRIQPYPLDPRLERVELIDDGGEVALVQYRFRPGHADMPPPPQRVWARSPLLAWGSLLTILIAISLLMVVGR
ncbi:MAG: hypothetical protein ACKV0T_17655 [Planctomycetales bacterium]